MAEGAWYDDTYSRAVRAAQEALTNHGSRADAVAQAECICPEYAVEAALYAMRYRGRNAMFAYPMAAVTEREMREVVLAVRGADERKVLFFALAARKLSPMAGTFRVVEMARILMAPLGRIKKAVEKLPRKGLIEISRAYGQTDGEWFFCGELPEKSDNDRVVAKVLLSDIQLNLADAFYSAVLGTFDCESEKVMAALSHRERLELAALSNAYRRHREAFDNRMDVDRLMKHIHAKQDALRIRQESG